MHRKVIAPLIIACTLIVGIVFLSAHKRHHDIYFGDSMGYYVYLPATFIYHNLQDMDWLPLEDSLGESVYKYVGEMKAYGLAIGQEHWVNQYTYGIALMEMPFFLGAHLYEKLLGKQASGYSMTYNNAIIFSSFFYALLGLWLVFLIIRRQFGVVNAAITVSLILLGTNLFWFTFWQGGMSHTPLFFLYALLIYLTIKVHETPRRKTFLLIGFVIGLVTVIRPTDLLTLLIPLLYNVYNKETLRQKLELIKKNASSILLAAIVFFLPIIPQLLYWKLTAGEFIYYSYGEQSFDWANPKIVEGLFYFKNGWLPYAPVMFFALAGIFLFAKTKKWAAVILTLLPAYIYIIYSWWCYNYINGFGSRPMIHLYPLLAIPLASFTAFVANRNAVIKLLYGAVCVFIAGVIYSLCGLQSQFMFKSEDANAPFYLGMIYKSKMNYENLLEYDLGEFQPDQDKLVKVTTLGVNDFDDTLSDHYVSDPEGPGYIYQMQHGEEYAPAELTVKYSNEVFNGAQWLRCSGRFMVTEYAKDKPHIFVLTVLNNNGDLIKWSGCKLDNKIGIADSSCEHAGGAYSYFHAEYWLWSDVYFYTRIPDNIEEGNTLRLNMWNISKEQIFMDDFKIELYRE